MRKISFVLAFVFIIPFNAYAGEISADSAVVIDADTNEILYEKNAYIRRSMASTTKIMTALLAVESGRLDETVNVKKEMLNVEGSSLGLRGGDKLTLYDLIVGMMLTSGNDSANCAAYFISGSVEKFAKLMNKRASEIGMKDTKFVTPSGLDEKNHHSTAFDMALLTSAAVKIDTFCEIVSKQKAEIKINGKTVTVYNHNRLLAMDKNIFGVKTGFTEKAGRCLVSAKNYKNNKLICVTLFAPDDWDDHLALYNQCEKKYICSNVKKSCNVWLVGGKNDIIHCSYSAQYYTISGITVKEYYYPFVYAPVRKGDAIGFAYVYSNKKLLERLPIEADEDSEYYGKQK